MLRSLPLLALCLLLCAPAPLLAQDQPAAEPPEEEAPDTLIEETLEQEVEIVDDPETDAPEDELLQEEVEEVLDQEEAALDFVMLDVWGRLPLDFELIGSNERDRRDVAGTAHVITTEEIRRTAPRSTAELMELLPGVTVANKDAMGLRLNLGMRGFSPSQSTYTLVLEDGIPIAASPYLDGAVLYTTPVEKVSRVELLTGSSSILYGPQNMGGAINLVTTAPPRSFTVHAYGDGGSFGRARVGGYVGDTKGVVGYLLEAHHRRYEGPRQLDLQATDLSAKFRLQVSERSWFGAKLSLYDEFSRASQTGLTQRIYARDPDAVVAHYDRDELDRLAASIQHTYLLGEFGMVQTALWVSDLSRALQQQRFDRQPRQTLSDYERIITGDGSRDPDSPGSLFFLDATDITASHYRTLGVESKLTADVPLGKLGRSELLLGLRGMREEIDTQRERGQHGGSPSGTSIFEEERQGRALAAYALSRFFFLKEHLRVEPGVRMESLRSERRVWRDVSDGQPIDLNPPRDGSDTTTALLPGVGSSLDLGAHLTLFGSAHRSMAIPEERLASALLDPQINLSPEFAWNFELGARLYDARALSLDLAGFLIQTENLTLQRVSLLNDSQYFEAGETRHLGGEAVMSFDPTRYVRTALRMPLKLSYAYTHATLTDGFSAPLIGNLVPDVPRHRWSAQGGIEHPLGLAAQVTARYTGERFSEIENVAAPSANGIRGTLDPRLSLDARLAYTHVPWRMTVYLLGKNLLDQRVVVTRDASGLQSAGARELMAGAEANF